MILFFKTQKETVIATQTCRSLSEDEISRLCWLYGDATPIEKSSLSGCYVGPRREMITPWSTNAVEITQNMNVDGILRIEEFYPVAGRNADYDPMLQCLYEGIGQDVFSLDIVPQATKEVTDIEAYNEEEGLALSPEEVDYLKGISADLGRPLTDSEVFGFAQINSEHCRHKIFGGTFIIDGKEQPCTLFEMIKKTTAEHPGRILSAYKDNVAFAKGPTIEQFSPTDQSIPDYFKTKKIKSVISLKAETHNFPTTVEPFNGASTGTGGEIRDRMGGGVGSCPIAGTAVYMTSYPRQEGGKSWEEILPVRKWLYQSPEQILIKASNGASDFGNKFGQPLIAGSVLTFEHLEDKHKYAYDKVIMLAGGVGYGNVKDALKGQPQKGNKVVVVGGDNYRIGLGGGSVSSVDTGRYAGAIELNAVQRANPEMQKRAYNLIRALAESDDNPMISIHDHGSAGHLNCLSELVEDCGGEIHIDRLPIGDKTLSAKEIIANESQERMGLLIDEYHIDRVRAIADRERAPLYVVGESTGDGHFSFVDDQGRKPFDLDVSQMFGHSPRTVMKDTTVERHYRDVEYAGKEQSTASPESEALNDNLLNRYIDNVLQLEAVACKDWLTNKVDRSVTGKVAMQQCQGELQLPLADCGVVALDYRGVKGIATSIGHAPQVGIASASAGAVNSVAEALTNIVWAPLTDGLGGVSLSANWMWPCRSQAGEDARLYEAVQALSDFCIQIGVNVPTGKDSLSMTQQYPDGQKIISPGTVIVSAAGEVEDIKKAVKPVLVTDKRTSLYYIDFSFDSHRLGGSAFAQTQGCVGDDVPRIIDPEYFADCFEAMQTMIKKGWIISGHDISAGGMITTLLEMCFANAEGGLRVNLNGIAGEDLIKKLFSENPGVIIQVSDNNKKALLDYLEDAGIGCTKIGYPTPDERIIRLTHGQKQYTLDIPTLRDSWYHTSYLLDTKQSFNGMAKKRYANYKKQKLEFSFPKGFTGQLKQYGLNPDRKQMSGIKAAIIREKGTNGDREMAYALYLAGFDVKDVTMTDLIQGRETLQDIQMIVFCGGFSNSDVLGSAKGWAGAFLYNPKAKKALDAFYKREDTLSLGICNGCQLMEELNLINPEHQYRTHLTHNISKKFESRYLTLSIPQNNSVMLKSLSGCKLGVWVAHGEGKFYMPHTEDSYHIIAKYNYAEYPGNPNGSDYNVAGLCSADGRHLALMPHPERAVLTWQNPWYPSDRSDDEITPWMEAFVNAYKWIEDKNKNK